jgi:hypothetical protein
MAMTPNKRYDAASDHNRPTREQLGETPDHRFAALGIPEFYEVLERNTD